jgi:hypothetical protein
MFYAGLAMEAVERRREWRHYRTIFRTERDDPVRRAWAGMKQEYAWHDLHYYLHLLSEAEVPKALEDS